MVFAVGTFAGRATWAGTLVRLLFPRLKKCVISICRPIGIEERFSQIQPYVFSTTSFCFSMCHHQFLQEIKLYGPPNDIYS